MGTSGAFFPDQEQHASSRRRSRFFFPLKGAKSGKILERFSSPCHKNGVKLNEREILCPDKSEGIGDAFFSAKAISELFSFPLCSETVYTDNYSIDLFFHCSFRRCSRCLLISFGLCRRATDCDTAEALLEYLFSSPSTPTHKRSTFPVRRRPVNPLIPPPGEKIQGSPNRIGPPPRFFFLPLVGG